MVFNLFTGKVSIIIDKKMYALVQQMTWISNKYFSYKITYEPQKTYQYLGIWIFFTSDKYITNVSFILLRKMFVLNHKFHTDIRIKFFIIVDKFLRAWNENTKRMIWGGVTIVVIVSNLYERQRWTLFGFNICH